MSTHRFISIFATTALALSLAACGGDGDSAETPTDPSTPEQPAPDPTPNPTPDPGPVDPNPDPTPQPDPDPDPAPGGDTHAACTNDAMFRTGSSWTVTMQMTHEGGLPIPATTFTMHEKVNGPQTYAGYSAIEMQSWTDDEPGYSLSYSAFVGDQYVGYGAKDVNGSGQVTLAVRYVPPMGFPRAMEQGKPYSASSRLTFDVGGSGDYDVSMTQTYLGQETISVPAGDFQTCKIRIETTVLGTTSVVDGWYVASGAYHGLQVQTRTNNMGIQSTARATQLSADFK